MDGLGAGCADKLWLSVAGGSDDTEPTTAFVMTFIVHDGSEAR